MKNNYQLIIFFKRKFDYTYLQNKVKPTIIVMLLFSALSLFAATDLMPSSDSRKLSMPDGKLIKFCYSDSKLNPGFAHEITVYIPKQYDPEKPAALYVQQDGGKDDELYPVFDTLIKEKAMPVCIGVFISPKIHISCRSKMGRCGLRCQEYDDQSHEYADFVINDLLPYLKQKYNINISNSPDMHMIGGGSCGGCCAWVAAWTRNDFFHRVFIISPAFVAFRGGNGIPSQIRKYETKPLRVYLTVGTKDLVCCGGNFHLAALDAEDALKYAGYDYHFDVIEGPHGVGGHKAWLFDKAMRWSWDGWEKPIKVKKLAPRIAEVVSAKEGWQKYNGVIPASKQVVKNNNGIFTGHGNEIILTKPDGKKLCAGKGFNNVSSLAFLGNGRLLVADWNDRFIYCAGINDNGMIVNKFKFGRLEIPDSCQYIGSGAIIVDHQRKKVFVASALGVQIFAFAGQHNAILPVPGNLPVVRIATGGADNSFLYAKTNDGVIYRRKLSPLRGKYERF